MGTSIYLLTLCLPLAVILLVFWMRYRALGQQAELRYGSDDAYRQIAEKLLSAEAASTAALVALQAELGDVRDRLASIEKILKDVE
jgi:hypothetical protein